MQGKRKFRMLLVMPLLVIPFLTMGFWALGGGKGEKVTSNGTMKGLNLHLPDANLRDDKAIDKLGFYERADKDSLKREQYIKNDPYYSQQELTTDVPVNQLEEITQTTASKFNQRLKVSPYDGAEESPEKKVMDKLSLLQKDLAKAPRKEDEVQDYLNYHGKREGELGGQVDQLESLLGMMSTNGSGEDPEIKQLEGTLDKILDIQHPSRVQDRIKEKSVLHKGIVYPVTKEWIPGNISLLDTGAGDKIVSSGFYGLDDEEKNVTDHNAIEAVVHQDQVLINGAVIKLRLLHDVFVNGNLISKGTFVYGIVSLHDERLNVDINSIRNGLNLFPVKLAVYDMDGLTGIYIPGAISRDVAKQTADNSLQLMELSSMDPSLKTQATAAGINAAKSLFSKKIKLVKVAVKAGYKVLLKGAEETP